MTIRNCYTSDKNIPNKKITEIEKLDISHSIFPSVFIICYFLFCFFFFFYIYHKWLTLIVRKHDIIENNRQRTIGEQQTMIDRGIFMDSVYIQLLTILSQESNFNSTSIRYLVIVLSINSPTNSFLDFLGKTASSWRFSLNLCHSLVTWSPGEHLFLFLFFFIKISRYKVMFPGEYSNRRAASISTFNLQNLVSLWSLWIYSLIQARGNIIKRL